MANKILDGTDGLGQRFGECQHVTHDTGDALPQGVVATLGVIGFPGFLREGFIMLSSWNHTFVSFLVIRIEHHLLTVRRGKVGPQLFRTVATAIPPVERNDFPLGGQASVREPRCSGRP